MIPRGAAPVLLVVLSAWFGLSACAERSASPTSVTASPGDPPSALRRDARCGQDMLAIRLEQSAFCIDIYEAPGFGALPHQATLDDARKACLARGHRLCAESEWEAACRGSAGRRFPWGHGWEPLTCNTGGAKVTESGMKTGCRSEAGIHDLTGNVAEWVENGMLKGGDADADEFSARCAARARPDDDGAPTRTGWRCCTTIPLHGNPTP